MPSTDCESRGFDVNDLRRASIDWKEFSGLLRVICVTDLKGGLFKATSTLVNLQGNVADRNSLYLLKSSYTAMGSFVEAGQIWNVTSAASYESYTESQDGYRRPLITVEPVEASLTRPSGKHLIWHFTHSDYYPGIGKGKAQNLIHELSNQSGHEALYKALDDGDINELTKARTITTWDAEVLVEGWKKHGSTKVLSWFEERDIDPRLAKQVFDFHGASTITAIEEDPYRLASFNLPWKKVDGLARGAFGVARDDQRRLQAAVSELMWDRLSDGGHTKISSSKFKCLIRGYLGDDLDQWVQAHINMLDDSRAILREGFIHHFESAVMEAVIVNRIGDLLITPYASPLSDKDKMDVLYDFQVVNGFALTDKQIDAVSTSLNHRFSIITGGAGVGKTTVLKALYALYDKAGFTRIQLALSGRAAQRMFEATEEKSSTIASYVHHFKWHDIPVPKQEKTVLVIDEASMVDIHSMYRIIEMTPKPVHLILVGDPYQLPPVGPGLVLHELVSRDYLPSTELNVVRRQGADSSIPRVANDIRTGVIPESYGEDVLFVTSEADQIASDAVCEYLKAPESSQILCATKRLVKEVNSHAQEQVNPDGQEVCYAVEGVTYSTGIRKGDPVLCNVNMYDKYYDLRNGSLGRIVNVYAKPEKVQFAEPDSQEPVKSILSYGQIKWDDGHETEMSLELIENIQLSYGITVHKAQGSQFDIAIFAAKWSPILDRTLVYTALTRAAKRSVVLGDIGAVKEAILAPTSASNRMVGLGDFLDDVFVGVMEAKY